MLARGSRKKKLDETGGGYVQKWAAWQDHGRQAQGEKGTSRKLTSRILGPLAGIRVICYEGTLDFSIRAKSDEIE